jgi:hypothetical protein
MDSLEEAAREAYDRTIGPEPSDVAVDCCLTKAPCRGEKAGKSPVDRGKQGLKRSTMVDAECSPLGTTKRWFVERTNSWTNAHKKLTWCTEREGRVLDFWIAFSNALIIVGRLIREAWTHYRWEGRSARRP